MTTNVIILCQGQQQRLPELGIPKQLLGLEPTIPARLLDRTLIMVGSMLTPADTITIIGGSYFRNRYTGSSSWRDPRGDKTLNVHELATPGNSSLKGVAAALHDRQYMLGDPQSPFGDFTKTTRTILLLGDVLYSWACLAPIIEFDRHKAGCLFVGSHDLSPSAGELWGIGWKFGERSRHSPADTNTRMKDGLQRALAKHPPFADTYQCGQLRRWYWEMNEGRTRPASHYLSVDDYTMDVDLPEHIAKLAEHAKLAREDDIRHGLDWEWDEAQAKRPT